MKTISRIAYSNDKKNKTRSILIMMSICLTTMLLVIISTVGNGMIRLQKSQAAGSYGSNYGLFVSADGSQLKEVNRRAEIDATGTMCTEGIIKGNEKGGFVCMDETARKMLPYNKEYELKEGKYPEKMQEIAAGRAFFSEMGYDDVKVGDTVTLDYRAGMQSEYKPEEFVVSGILYDRDEYTIEPILCAILSADAAYVVGAIGQALAKHHRKAACGPPGAGREVEGFLADRLLYGVALGIVQAEATVKGVGMAHISAC